MMSRHKDQARSSMRSLASSSGFETFVVDQLSELGEVTPRKMFGGVGLYYDALFFGIIARDELYLKVDDLTRGSFEAAGSTPFRPYGDRAGTMQYYGVPLGVLESAPELVRWARQALAAAARATGAGSPKRKKRATPAASRRR
jgi:DNA transformation protein